ncbi:unnamed protein product, partial [Discosporangium mesarthrocarpum]
RVRTGVRGWESADDYEPCGDGVYLSDNQEERRGGLHQAAFTTAAAAAKSDSDSGSGSGSGSGSTPVKPWTSRTDAPIGVSMGFSMGCADAPPASREGTGGTRTPSKGRSTRHKAASTSVPPSQRRQPQPPWQPEATPLAFPLPPTAPVAPGVVDSGAGTG